MKRKVKEIEDSVIMENLLKELSITARQFALDLELNPNSIYFILKGSNRISESLQYKIMKKYPDVHYWYLEKGKLPVLMRNEKLEQAQANIFVNSENKKVDYSLEIFGVLKSIESGITEQNELTKELIDLLKQKKADQ